MTAKSLRIVQNNRENKALTDVELLKHIGAEADDARIGGNVWGPAGSLHQGGYHSTSDGWISPTTWQSNHPTDTFPGQLDATSIGTAGAALHAPHAPQSLTAVATAGQIALAWAAAGEGDAPDTYNLYRDAGDGNGYRLYQSGLSGTGYTDTNVTADTRYAYKVSAVNSVGEGKLSDEAADVALAGTQTPDAPTNLSATPGDGQVTLTWDAVTGADSYNVYRGASTGGETLLQSGVTDPNYTDTNAANGTEYFYTVAAVNAGGESPQSDEVSATPQVSALAAPTNLAATPGDGQVALTWDAVAGADSYNVYAALSSGEEGTAPIATGLTSPTYTDTFAPNGTTIYYQVTAVDAAGESLPLAEVSATPQYRLTISGNESVAEGAVYTLTLSSNVPPGTFSEIQIDWGDGSATQSITPSTTSATHTFTPGIDGAMIFASGVINEDEMAWSNPELVDITDVTPPAAPTSLTASSSAIREVDVSWSAGSSDALNYTVQRSEDDGQSWKEVGTVYGDQTSYSDFGLSPATAYSYRVIAANDGGSSDPSAVITATTPDEDLHFSYHRDENGQVILTWTDPTDLGVVQQGMGVESAAMMGLNAAASTPVIHVTGYELEEKNLDPSVNENFHFLNTLSTPYLIYAPSIGPNDHVIFRMRADYNDGTVGDYHTLNVSPPPEAPPEDPNEPSPTLDAPSNVHAAYDNGFPTAVAFDSGYGSGDDFEPYALESEIKIVGDPYAVILVLAQASEPITKTDDGHWQARLYDADAYAGITYAGPIRVVHVDVNGRRDAVSPWSDPASYTQPGKRVKAPQLDAEDLGNGNVSLTVSMDSSGQVGIYRVPGGPAAEGAATQVFNGNLSSGQSVTVAAGPSGSRFFAVLYARSPSDDPNAPSGTPSFGPSVSPYSNFVDATGTTKPAAPNVVWTSYKTTSNSLTVTVAWHNTPDNEDGYVIERRKAGAGNDAWQEVGHTGTDETTYTDTISVTANNSPYQYDYRVSAKNSAGTSDPSPVTTVAPGYGGPDITANLHRIEQYIVQEYQSYSWGQKKCSRVRLINK